MSSPQDDFDSVQLVDRLRAAAWLRFNGEKLLARRLRADGIVLYVFKASSAVDMLMKKWEAKSSREVELARFSRLVSFEIQTAVRLRRAAGLSTRIRYAERQ